MANQSTHRCPVAGCSYGGLPRGILMCTKHWRRIPKPLRDAVYAAWNRGNPHPDYWRIREQAILAAEGC